MRKLLLMSLFLAATAVWAADVPKTDLQARRDALNALLAEQWEYTLSNSPEFASILGDKRWNDKVSDFSQAAIDADLAKTHEFLKRFEAVDTTGFPEQEVLNKELMVRGLEEGIEGAKFKGWLMPVNQMSGIHLMAPQFPPLLTFTSVKDYDDLITRYKKIPKLFDDTIAHMREGMAAGLMPPKFLLEKVASQVEGIAAVPAEQSPFAAAAAEVPQGDLRGRAAAHPRGDARRHSRLDPARLCQIRQIREGGVRAERTDRAGHVVAAGRRQPLRLGGPAADDVEPHAGGDPPDRPARSGPDRGADAGDRQEARLQGREEPQRRHRGRSRSCARSRGSRSSTSTPGTSTRCGPSSPSCSAACRRPRWR